MGCLSFVGFIRIAELLYEELVYSKCNPAYSEEFSGDGRYLANFKKVESTIYGTPVHGNDMLPCVITKQKDSRLYIYWDNQWSCTIDEKYVNLIKLTEKE